jgi:hypothetical protein
MKFSLASSTLEKQRFWELHLLARRPPCKFPHTRLFRALGDKSMGPRVIREGAVSSLVLVPSRSMNLDPEELAASYAKLGEPELLDLARSYDSLTDSAQAALRAEFARRNLDPPTIEDVEDRAADRRNLVILRRYRDLSEAIVARSLLKSAGIYVFLCDENLVRLDWQMSNFIGGIRLQVEAKDEQAAIDLLNQSIPTSIPYGAQAEFFQPHCPNCGSTDITFQGSSRGAALASLYVLSLPLPLGNETWLCNSCESRWKDTEDDSN